MKKTIGRDLPNGTYVEIEATDHVGDDQVDDYFAVTCLAWEQSGTWSGRTCALHGRDPVIGGADHDMILKAAPGLAPLTKIHMAALDGTPMHAAANGWYFYSGKARAYELNSYGEKYVEAQGTDHERAARALHIDKLDLPVGMDADDFTTFVGSLTQVWADQAAAAREVLEGLVDGDGVEDR